MNAHIRLCRPHQYLKNAFVLAPLFFAQRITDIHALLPTLLAALAFCMVASAIYILNDLRDVEEDRKHPSKCKRPIASGEVRPSSAKLMGLVLLLGGMGLAAWANRDVFMLLGLYLVINFAYSLGLKKMSLVDVLVIAVGFVIRLYVGGAASQIQLSKWIVIMTFLLALFLALAKRRDDLVLALNGHGTMRASMGGYNKEFLSTTMALITAVVCVAYIMYALSEDVVARVGNENLFFTAFFVILGFLRYLQITLVEERSGSPTRVILHDRFIQVIILGWVATFAAIIY